MRNLEVVGKRPAYHRCPRAWQGARWRLWAGRVFWAVVCSIFVGASVMSALGGSVVVAVAAASGAAGVALLLLSEELRWMRTGATRPDLRGVRIAGAALVIRADDRERAVDIALPAAFALGGAGAFYAVFSGELDLSFVQHSPRPVSPFTFLAVAVTGAVGLVWEMVRRRPDPLVLTPHALIVGKRLGPRGAIAWTDLERTEPMPTDVGRRRRGADAWLAIGADEEPRLRCNVVRLGAPATFWLLDFYRRHPELRDELGDARVLRRLRDGSLVDDGRADV
ncbi:hypothetical protein [Gordonia polyisoprenivorans]|uniref:hypothetical protein n=1 Tax=Gordonia polyisoprenivorans TaxID=84595 RepID=UPI001AD641E7|nr:hypothetical protein [Gordonia polyisoprenivorans]QTI67767.1 hypothetical protein J6U32_19705 [Gordonia polyisoprenivorans]